MPRTASLTREQVLQAGLEVLAERGLGAVTMREVAARLGVEAMSLYTYVRNKEDLTVGMTGAVLAGIDHHVDEQGWEAVVRAFGHRYYAALVRYPDLIPLVQSIPPSTHLLAGLETVMAALARAGLDRESQVSALRGLLAMCMGLALVVSRPGQPLPWDQWPIDQLADEHTSALRDAATAFDTVTSNDDMTFMIDNCIRGITSLTTAPTT